MQRLDVVVVGAGITGSAAGWALARRGQSVLVLDRHEAGHQRGSSHGGSRIFRLSYPDPFWVDFARAALEAWHRLEQDAEMPLLTPTGALDHGDPDALGAIVGALDHCGVGCELLAPSVATARWPGMRFVGPVCFQPGGGRIEASAARSALVEQVRRRGGEVEFGVGAVAIEPAEDSVVVRLADGRAVEAGTAVVAVGGWLAGLVGEWCPLPPLEVTQESVFHFAPRDVAGFWPSFIHHGPTAIYGLETPGEGVKVAEHHSGAPVDPDERDFLVDPGSRERVVQHVEEWLPGLVPIPSGETTCLYTSTPDEEFVLDRRGRVVIASPCSGHGFKFAPLIGERIAELVAGADPVPRFRLP
jgi:sarcosine oxidase